jgi:hypothetical protein
VETHSVETVCLSQPGTWVSMTVEGHTSSGAMLWPLRVIDVANEGLLD